MALLFVVLGLYIAFSRGHGSKLIWPCFLADCCLSDGNRQKTLKVKEGFIFYQ